MALSRPQAGAAIRPASMLVLAGLFLAAFLSATLLPGSSEAALAAVLAAGQAAPWVAIGVATVGNTLGSVVNWGLGRYFAHWRGHPRFPVPERTFSRYEAWYGRWGVWSLLLSWAPVIGDPLTAIAGVFGTPLWLFVPVVALAKFARYLVLAGAVSMMG